MERWLGTWTDIHEYTETLRLAEEEIAVLREANRRKDRLLAKLAHEFRSPLSAVAGAIELLRTDQPEERDWATEVIVRQTGLLKRLIEDLGLDSLDLLEFYLRLGDKFDITVNEDDYPTLTSVDAIVAFLQERVTR